MSAFSHRVGRDVRSRELARRDGRLIVRYSSAAPTRGGQVAPPASTAAAPAAAENPLRTLRSHQLLESLVKALLIAHMGGPPA